MDELSNLANKVSPIVEQLLPDTPQKNCKGTKLHDPVWGSINLQAHEVAFINTKLFQRLRRIKQLGSAHLVFPGAEHTRFEHSLGVVYQTNKICEGLRSNNENLINDFELENLRFVALCHDIGHGPLSHYSEKFFNDKEPFKSNLINNSAEFMSMQIVQSDAFNNYCQQLNKVYQCNLDPKFIAQIIYGELPNDKYYLGEIISGAFDADKLDYLTRDGFYCGIPINIDTDKLYASMTVCDYQENGVTKKRIAGHHSATAALLQVINHKHHMYTVVYGHKISRIFRAMFINALNYAMDNKVLINNKVISCFSDFLELDDEILFTPGVIANSITADIFSDLRNRNLFKVAVTYDKELIDESRREDLIKDSDSICAEIANKVNLPKEYIVLDIAQRIQNQEANNMLIINKGYPETLGTYIDLPPDGMLIYNSLEHHLLCCPADKTTKVATVAKDIFKKLI